MNHLIRLPTAATFFDTQQMSSINNPLAPFINGEFLKSPLEKGDSGGCLTAMLSTLKFLYIKLQQYPHISRPFGEMDGIEIFQQRDCVFTGGFGYIPELRYTDGTLFFDIFPNVFL